MKFSLRSAVWAISALVVAVAPAMAQDMWKPSQPVTIIVPWSAGGSTDQVTRIVAGELEDALGGNIVVQNQPGASGSIGTKAVLEGPHDGYTWAAGAAQDLGTYIVLGMLDTKIQDWHLYLDVANVAVVGVNADAPYKDMGDFLKAMQDNPDSVTVATAGITSGGHNAIEAIKAAAGGDYKHVTYDGGNPAVILKGYGEIPPITKWIPGFNAAPNYFGIFVPNGTPDEVIAALDAAWKDKIANSEALKDYAEDRGAVFAPYYGEDAQKRVQPAISTNAWLLYDGGKATVDPSTVGIPRP
jgi:tripartite-type tricarboxylate transporter receptor subunit TctC